MVTPASMIVFSTFMSVIWLKTRLRLPEVVGIVLIVASVPLSGFHEFYGTGSELSTYLIFVFGRLLWSIYTVSAKRFTSSALHATAIVPVFSIIGACC